MVPRTESPTAVPRNRVPHVKAALLLAGFLSFVFSVYLWFFVDKEAGLFVGIWVPSMWSLGALLLAGEQRGAA
ncbi:MAG: hypothetical protein AB1Z57_11460 [Acidimicrobiia bacterium]